ncbi:MAG: PRC-barrel domain-containing protein [Acidimicrobiia bacterium]
MTSAAILSAGTLTGDSVVNSDGDKLGDLKDIMIDFDRGTVAYGVLSRGGVAGIGEKLFAVPWALFQVNGGEKDLILDLDEERLENSPGFDPDNWPTFADEAWGRELHEHYGVDPYWGSSHGAGAPPSGL